MERSLWQGVKHGCYRQSHAGTATVALMLAVHRNRGTWQNRIHRYIALTAFARHKFLQAGFPADRVVVKPNFVSPDPGPRQSDGSHALFLGRVSREKGVSALLDAWAQMDPNFRVPLLIGGDGPDMQELKAQARTMNLRDVRFLGRVPRDQVSGLMKEARFLVFPSKLYENFPMTIVEAFACGVPVVASNQGAMPEIVREGRCGLLFRPGEPRDLAEKLSLACSRPDLTCELGRNARQEWSAKYTAERNYQRLLAIYQDAREQELEPMHAAVTHAVSVFP